MPMRLCIVIACPSLSIKNNTKLSQNFSLVVSRQGEDDDDDDDGDGDGDEEQRVGGSACFAVTE